MKKKIYQLPANTEVWSIDLQETIKIKKDIFVSLEHTTTISDYVFVKKCLHFSNMALSFLAGTDCSSYVPTKIEFGVMLNKLKFVKEIEIDEAK